MTMLARLFGYNERVEADTTVTVNISQMSDMELQRPKREVDEQIRKLEGKPVDQLPAAKEFG